MRCPFQEVKYTTTSYDGKNIKGKVVSLDSASRSCVLISALLVTVDGAAK